MLEPANKNPEPYSLYPIASVWCIVWNAVKAV